MVSNHLRNGRNGLRNQTIFLLSVKSGLRAKEISQLSWKEVCNSDGEVDTQINLTNQTSKGNSGRVIPLHKSVRENLIELLERHKKFRAFNINTSFIVRTERSPLVIPPFLAGCGCRTYAAIFSFMAGVMPPMPIFGRSLL